MPPRAPRADAPRAARRRPALDRRPLLPGVSTRGSPAAPPCAPKRRPCPALRAQLNCGCRLLTPALHYAQYLSGEGLTAATLADPTWVENAETADKVARAVVAWGADNGATAWTHWFQPLGA